MLRKYIPNPSHVLREQPIQLKENLTYEETPVHIVDCKEQVLRSKVIPLVKVLWRNHERRQLLGSQRFKCTVSILNYFLIEVFSFPLNLVCSFRGRNVLKEGGFVTPRPYEGHSTCNCKGTCVHQVPL